jgi:hypothetical protein
LVATNFQAAKSEEFHASFRANADVKVIEVSEMTLQELKAFVTFIYTGSISNNITLECIPTFFRAAEKYKVQFLAEVCEDTLLSNISRENAITTFDIAKKHCSSSVRESVLMKAIKMGEISTYDEYKHYTEKDPGLLLELYEQLSERIGPLLAKRRRISTGKSHQQLHACHYVYKRTLMLGYLCHHRSKPIYYYLCPVMMVHYTKELVNATGPSLRERGSSFLISVCSLFKISELLALMIHGFVLYADIGTSEQDLVNNTFILYGGCDGKSNSDGENSENHSQADEREMKPENEIAPGKSTH